MADGEAAQIEQAALGDPAALRSMLERFGLQVWHEIRGQIGRQWQASIDADDVMQITYVEAFLHIGALEARDATGFVAWLRRIAQNNLRDAIKELERKKRPPPANRMASPDSEESYAALIELLGVDSVTPSRDAARGEVRSIMHGVLEQLPPDYATVVRRYDLEGRDIDEVAREMGRTPGAIHMLRARAHDRLRALLGAEARFFSAG